MSASDFFSSLGFIIPAGLFGGGGIIAILFPLIKKLKEVSEPFRKFCEFVHELFCKPGEEEKKSRGKKKKK